MANIGRPQVVGEWEIIEAGYRVMCEGRRISGKTLRSVIGRGDTVRLADVWEDHEAKILANDPQHIVGLAEALIYCKAQDAAFYDEAIEHAINVFGHGFKAVTNFDFTLIEQEATGDYAGVGDVSREANLKDEMLLKLVRVGATSAIWLLRNVGWKVSPELMANVNLKGDTALAQAVLVSAGELDAEVIGQHAFRAMENGHLEMLRFLTSIGADLSSAECQSPGNAIATDIANVAIKQGNVLGEYPSVAYLGQRLSAFQAKAAFEMAHVISRRACIVFALRSTNVLEGLEMAVKSNWGMGPALAPGSALEAVRLEVAKANDSEITDAMRSADPGYDAYLASWRSAA
jgi:hypothetical protein